MTRPMSLWLDLLRALAALAVVVGHAVRIGLYTGPFPFSRALEKNAVVVFFVLSGLVIAATADRHANLRSYVIARASRILPVAWGAILVALGVGAIDAGINPQPMFAEHLRWADLGEALQAALFLSESYNTDFSLDPAYWSLCYEVWFYALFAAAYYLRGAKRIFWLIALAIAAGPNPLLLMPTWLIGVWIVRNPAAWNVPRPKARIYIALAFASLLIVPQAAPGVLSIVRTVLPWDLGYSLYAFTDLAIALAIAAGFIGLRTLSQQGFILPAACERPVRFLAGISFSLYLLHWPIMKLMLICGLRAGDSSAAFFALILLIVATCAGFAAMTEHRRGAVRALLEALGRKRAPALAV